MYPTECSDVSSNARATPRQVGTSSAVDGSWSAIETLRLRIADLHRRASEVMARERSEHAIGFAPS